MDILDAVDNANNPFLSQASNGALLGAFNANEDRVRRIKEEQDEDEDDDDDLGPETDVDAVDEDEDEVDDVLVSPSTASAATNPFLEKTSLDKSEVLALALGGGDDDQPTSLEPEPLDTLSTSQLAKGIGELENVGGDSENDSEDEWNYYRVEPTEEKGAPQDIDSGAGEDMESQLNPNAAVFIPSTPPENSDLKEQPFNENLTQEQFFNKDNVMSSSFIAHDPLETSPESVEVEQSIEPVLNGKGDDEVWLAGSPSKGGVPLDNVKVPAEDEFDREASMRPGDLNAENDLPEVNGKGGLDFDDSFDVFQRVTSVPESHLKPEDSRNAGFVGELCEPLAKFPTGSENLPNVIDFQPVEVQPSDVSLVDIQPSDVNVIGIQSSEIHFVDVHAADVDTSDVSAENVVPDEVENEMEIVAKEDPLIEPVHHNSELEPVVEERQQILNNVQEETLDETIPVEPSIDHLEDYASHQEHVSIDSQSPIVAGAQSSDLYLAPPAVCGFASQDSSIGLNQRILSSSEALDSFTDEVKESANGSDPTDEHISAQSTPFGEEENNFGLITGMNDGIVEENKAQAGAEKEMLLNSAQNDFELDHFKTDEDFSGETKEDMNKGFTCDLSSAIPDNAKFVGDIEPLSFQSNHFEVQENSLGVDQQTNDQQSLEVEQESHQPMDETFEVVNPPQSAVLQENFFNSDNLVQLDHIENQEQSADQHQPVNISFEPPPAVELSSHSIIEEDGPAADVEVSNSTNAFSEVVDPEPEQDAGPTPSEALVTEQPLVENVIVTSADVEQTSMQDEVHEVCSLPAPELMPVENGSDGDHAPPVVDVAAVAVGAAAVAASAGLVVASATSKTDKKPVTKGPAPKPKTSTASTKGPVKTTTKSAATATTTTAPKKPVASPSVPAVRAAPRTTTATAPKPKLTETTTLKPTPAARPLPLKTKISPAPAKASVSEKKPLTNGDTTKPAATKPARPLTRPATAPVAKSAAAPAAKPAAAALKLAAKVGSQLSKTSTAPVPPVKKAPLASTSLKPKTTSSVTESKAKPATTTSTGNINTRPRPATASALSSTSARPASASARVPTCSKPTDKQIKETTNKLISATRSTVTRTTTAAAASMANKTKTTSSAPVKPPPSKPLPIRRPAAATGTTKAATTKKPSEPSNAGLTNGVVKNGMATLEEIPVQNGVSHGDPVIHERESDLTTQSLVNNQVVA